jgi:hypothetical protein
MANGRRRQSARRSALPSCSEGFFTFCREVRGDHPDADAITWTDGLVRDSRLGGS